MKNFTYRDALRVANFICIFLLIISAVIYGVSYLNKGTYKFNDVKFTKDVKLINDRLSFFQGKKFLWGEVLDTLSTVYREFQEEDIELNPFEFINRTNKSDVGEFKATDTIFFKYDTISTKILDTLKSLENVKFKSFDSLRSHVIAIAGKRLAQEYQIPDYQKFFNSQIKYRNTSIVFFILTIFFGISFPLAFIYDQRLRLYTQATKAESLNQELKENPNDLKPAWEKAQLTLEQYYNRNLSQINMIFWVSVAVMLAGFILISIGIIIAYNAEKGSNFIPIVSTSSGIITEFIGATFIVIYNSTIKQASTYTLSLEKINSVGMSVTILNGIAKDAKDASDANNTQKTVDAKIEIAKAIALIEKTTSPSSP